MRKIILCDEEYAMLQKVLRAVPPAHLPRILPDWDGADMHYYRCLLTKVLHKNYHFPKTDDVEETPEWGMHPVGEFDPPYIYSEPNHPEISEYDLEG